jgi:molybdopterin molybdotransferase
MVLAGIQTPEPFRVALDEAYGCVLAAELAAPGDLPPFTSSAMDGYAVRSWDVAGASAEHPVRLQVSSEVRVGFPASTAVTAGNAAAVPTGGMLPEGADSVVPVELCRPEAETVLITAPSPSGRNVRPTGEDLRRGEVLAPAGRRLEGADLGALAAGGFAFVEVFPRPRVSILSTGNELIPPGGELRAGQIFESNSFMLRALVRSADAAPSYAGHVPDDPDALMEAVSAAASGADLVVCSGGVSAGREDPVKRAFAGSESVRFAQVAVQPGRPQAFGTWRGKPFFGLPGNPMAALVGFELFVRPALNKMSGIATGPAYREAVAGEGMEASPDCVRYLPVMLCLEGSVLVASAGGGRRSNQLAKVARAGALAEIPAGHNIAPGDACRVIPLGASRD